MAVNTSSNITGPHDVSTSPVPPLTGPQTLDASNLDVYGPDINGVLVQLTKDVHYTVVSIGDASSINIITNNGAETVFIENVQPQTQIDDYVNGQKFDAVVAETSWDKAILAIQTLQGIINRCVKIPKSDRSKTTEVTSLTGNALKVITVKSDETGMELASITDSLSAAVTAAELAEAGAEAAEVGALAAQAATTGLVATDLEQFYDYIRQFAFENQNMNMICYGDSLTGITNGASYVDGMRTRFNHDFAKGSLGLVPLHPATDNGVIVDAGATQTRDQDQSAFGKEHWPTFNGIIFDANSQTATIGIPEVGCDIAKIGWIDRAGGLAGTWRYRATDLKGNDGPFVTVVTTSPATRTAKTELVVGLGESTGRFFIEINSVSSVSELAIPAVIFQSNKGVTVNRLAQGGLTAQNWVDQDRVSMEFWVGEINPSIASINLGQNDGAGDLPTFQANVETLIERIRRAAPYDLHTTDSQTNGTLTINRWYEISTFVAGDDFSNVNIEGLTGETGMLFKATGTTPTTYSNGSTIKPVTKKCSVIIWRWFSSVHDSLEATIQTIANENDCMLFNVKLFITSISYADQSGISLDDIHLTEWGSGHVANYLYDTLQINGGKVKSDYPSPDSYIDFSGTGLADFFTSIVTTNDFTFACAFRLPEADGATIYTIIDRSSNGANIKIQLRNSAIRFSVQGAADGAGSDTIIWRENKWYHLVVLRRSGVVEYYLDGADVGTETVSNSITGTSDQLGSGAEIQLSDILYLERAISSSEVTTLAGAQPIEEGNLLSSNDIQGSAGFQVASSTGTNEITLAANGTDNFVRNQKGRKFKVIDTLSADGFIGGSDRLILPASYANLQITAVASNATGPTITIGIASGDAVGRVASVVLNGTGVNGGITTLTVLDDDYDSQKVYVDFTANITSTRFIITGDII